MTAPCPVCGLLDGFHEHKDVQVPQQHLLPKGWLQELIKSQKEPRTDQR